MQRHSFAHVVGVNRGTESERKLLFLRQQPSAGRVRKQVICKFVAVYRGKPCAISTPASEQTLGSNQWEKIRTSLSRSSGGLKKYFVNSSKLDRNTEVIADWET